MSKPTSKPFFWIAADDFTIPCWPVQPRPEHPGRQHTIVIPKGSEVYWHGPNDPIPNRTVRFRDRVTPPLTWWQRAWHKLTTPRHRFPHR